MKNILIFLLVVALALVGILGYFGFVPGVSAIFGSNKPKDLGMVYSEESYISGLKKAEVELEKLEDTATEDIKYEGSHEVKDNFSDEELTAHAYDKDYVNYPISQVQVRINDDDTCEVSGIIDLNRVDDLLVSLGVSQEEYQKALKSAKIPVGKVPFYAKGAGTAANNQLDADITNFAVGRFSVPKGIVDQYSPALMSFGEQVMKSIDGFSVNEARFEDGSIYFDGTLPDVELAKRKY